MVGRADCCLLPLLRFLSALMRFPSALGVGLKSFLRSCIDREACWRLARLRSPTTAFLSHLRQLSLRLRLYQTHWFPHEYFLLHWFASGFVVASSQTCAYSALHLQLFQTTPTTKTAIVFVLVSLSFGQREGLQLLVFVRYPHSY